MALSRMGRRSRAATALMSTGDSNRSGELVGCVILLGTLGHFDSVGFGATIRKIHIRGYVGKSMRFAGSGREMDIGSSSILCMSKVQGAFVLLYFATSNFLPRNE